MARLRVSHVGDQSVSLPEGGAELLRHLGPEASLESTGDGGAGPYVYSWTGDAEQALLAGWRALETTGHASEWAVSLA